MVLPQFLIFPQSPWNNTNMNRWLFMYIWTLSLKVNLLQVYVFYESYLVARDLTFITNGVILKVGVYKFWGFKTIPKIIIQDKLTPTQKKTFKSQTHLLFTHWSPNWFAPICEQNFGQKAKKKFLSPVSRQTLFQGADFFHLKIVFKQFLHGIKRMKKKLNKKKFPLTVRP